MPAIRPGARGAVISGWGTALPEKILTNDELAATMDTSDEWIRSRTGIRERRIGGTTIGLSIESGRQALEMAGLDPSRIDALVLATTTPDKQWGTAAAVQNELGLLLRCVRRQRRLLRLRLRPRDGHGLIAMGADRVLVIGTDTLSRITDWDDRATAPLFADGSGAVVLESVDGPRPAARLGPRRRRLGARRSCRPRSAASSRWRARRSSGGRFGSWSTRPRSRWLHAGVTGDDIKLVVPHQANIRIIQAACDRLGVPIERAAIVIDRTGNTSSASIPLALADALDSGRIEHGDLILLVGFGGGMTAASCVLRWGGGVD